ncbi:polymer-forming cytoskeletal protein [Rhodohalobacter mucosus]|uniref:Polymer-forming cytoskeletal protein n=1 Tax=Rhodohalobacter mucosus TaxID=2079485 RepID=A0A316U188_9BACT|nr:polymer-forming cytoskeletal protein [Rhodohalobacter mucosus]PWN06636.1 hypothetical protein DDZ15_08965 [Rhodohalobacter mucosus]
MINKKSAPTTSPVSGSSSNYLSSAVSIRGSFTSENDATVAGTIQGDVHIKGTLKMDKNGYVKGKIFATNVDIAGKVEGEIHCENLASLRSTASIKADIHTKSLQVDADAMIEGQILMNKNGGPAFKK